MATSQEPEFLNIFQFDQRNHKYITPTKWTVMWAENINKQKNEQETQNKRAHDYFSPLNSGIFLHQVLERSNEFDQIFFSILSLRKRRRSRRRRWRKEIPPLRLLQRKLQLPLHQQLQLRLLQNHHPVQPVNHQNRLVPHQDAQSVPAQMCSLCSHRNK